MIRVGGATEVEVKEKKDRVDDALNATRAAVEEGVSPGGGVALLRAITALDGVKVGNPDQQTGVDIVRKAIQAPARQIVDNAGGDGAVVVGKLLESKEYAYGYDAQTGEYGDLVKLGIIDPTKVVRTALQDAASIAGLIVTTEATITEHPKKEAPRCRRAAAWAAWTSEGSNFRRREDAQALGIPGPFLALSHCQLAGPDLWPLSCTMTKISYAGYRFPPEIIQQAIWLYVDSL